MDTGTYFSSPLGGRPRRGRFLPNFSSMAARAAATSRGVTRRAASKGNSLAFGISLTLPAAGPPCTDEAVPVAWLSDREDHDEDADIGLADQPGPPLRGRRVLRVGSAERPGIVERGDGIGERHPVLRPIGFGLRVVPLEPHLRYIPES